MRERAADARDVADPRIRQRAQRAFEDRQARGNVAIVLELTQRRQSADAQLAGIVQGNARVFRLDAVQADKPGRAEHARFHHQHQCGAAGDRPDRRLLRVEHRHRLIE